MIKEIDKPSRASERFGTVMEYIPRAMADEIREIARSVDRLEERLSEVRVRADGLSTLTVGGACYPLFYRASRADVDRMMGALTGGEVYAHRDTISRGFISVRGIRVGISGFARYNECGSVGVGEISSLVFRLGGAVCDFAERLYSDWCELGMPGLLLASPPMGGKTTALRALAGYIGSGREPGRVVIVDERCEFDPAEYRNATVDILRGYRRAEGIEMAYRTMAAEVIIVDEIANIGEAEALLAAHGAGVCLIASAHADKIESIYDRVCLAPLLDAGVFGAAALIAREGRAYGYELSEVKR